MELKTTITIIAVGLLIFMAHLFAAFFRQRQVPDVLLLIVIGLIVGPFTGLIDKAFFGDIGSVFANITLVIILFEGGTGLRYNVLRAALRGTASLTTVSFLVSTLATGTLALFFFEYDPIRSFMLGAFLGGTASAVVIPMVNQMKMDPGSKTILILESAVSDVLCIVVGLTLFEAYKLGAISIGSMAFNILTGFAFSLLLGLVAGLTWSFLLNKVRNIHNSIFTTPAFVFIIYGIAELLGFSGAISALMFGITLANIDVIPLPLLAKYTRHALHTFNDTEKVFFSEVVFLLKTFFFVYMGISMVLTDILSITIGFALNILLFILRIPVVRLSVRRTLPLEDRIVMAFMIPKGLAAAVLASLPFQYGMEGGELIQNITYSTVLISIVFNSALYIMYNRTEKLKWFYAFFLARR
ncbi:MAG: sodium:proton exchanger [Bacteroidetes bacterium]|nr:MAG: sodium:proton exchanger [Bacteroidota bacterium]